MSRHEIRGAMPGDEDGLLTLARELDTVNLPHDRAHVQRLLAHTAASFAGELPPRLRKYVFVVRDVEADRLVGTSMIIAQLGRRGAPYIYFDVQAEEKDAGSVDRHFHHQLLRIGFSYDGPTELGGLVVARDQRKAPERLGLLASYVRFLFIAAHRAWFQDQLLAELLPPLEPDGTSHLWEAVGRHFTGMSYAEADRLSSENKDFIRDLFPRDPIYVTLLPANAQAVIGQVGGQTRGVERMLRRVGFTYANRVDPFDGGPHYTAATDDVTLVRGARTGPFGGATVDLPDGARCLVGRDVAGPPHFRAVETVAAAAPDGALGMPPAAAHALELSPGDRVHWLPLP